MRRSYGPVCGFFASPSFLTGMARVLDLGATLELYSYNVSPTPEEADARAIGTDWEVVGSDLAEAIRTVAAQAG